MSETLAEPSQDVETPVEAPAETPPPADTPAAETPPADAPDADATPKPNRGDRRFANLTARTAALESQLAEETRRREAAEALARAAKGDDDAPNPTETPEQIARRLIAEDQHKAKMGAVRTSGAKTFGPDDWNAKTGVLASLGALQNTDFMEALVELDNAPQIVAALADDTDALVTLLEKSPRAMAAELGRMSAKLETPPAAAAKPLSNAPRPPAPVTAPVVEKEPDLYDKNISMADFKKQFVKTYGKKWG